MKNAEDVLRQWALDEIQLNVGKGPEVWSRDDLTQMIGSMMTDLYRSGNLPKFVSKLSTHDSRAGYIIAANLGKNATPQWLAKFKSLAQAAESVAKDQADKDFLESGKLWRYLRAKGIAFTGRR
jgi:hypothetical protein